MYLSKTENQGPICCCRLCIIDFHHPFRQERAEEEWSGESERPPPACEWISTVA